MKMRWMMGLAALAALGAQPAEAQDRHPLARLSFMTGCWRGPAGDSVEIEETWNSADADVMLAATRYLRDNRVVGWEFSRIVADSAGIRLTPYPDGEPAPAFALDSISPGRVVFANPANDFPQRIIYSGDGESRLVVALAGGDRYVEWWMLPGSCGVR